MKLNNDGRFTVDNIKFKDGDKIEEVFYRIDGSL
jgi:hypothetical protein